MRRGITPVVAVALLMGMTVVASGGAYTFFTQATQQGMDEASASLNTELAVRSMRCADTSAVVGISNTGDRELTADTVSVFLSQDGTLLDTVSKDVSGAEVLQPGGFSELEFPFTTYLSPGTRYTVEVSFDDADYAFERTCRGQSGDLVGYWNFDEINSRTIADLTVNKNDGTFNGMEHNGTFSGLGHDGTLGTGSGSDSADPAWISDCPDGSCLALDAGDDRVTVPANTELNATLNGEDWTISFAFYPVDALDGSNWGDFLTFDTANAGHLRVEQDGAVNDGVSVYWSSDDGTDGDNPAYRICDIPGLEAGRWYRVTVTLNMSGEGSRCYRDGQETESRPAGTFSPFEDADGSIAVHSGAGKAWRVDDLRVYDGALNADAVRDIAAGEPPVDGIVAYYPLDEGTGQTAWNSAFQAPGVRGGAARFDGTDDVVTAPDHPDLDITGELTVTAWVKRTAQTPQYPTIVQKGSRMYDFYLRSTDEVAFYCSGCNLHQTPGADIPADTWTHVAAVYDDAADRVRIYVDGELERDASESGSLSTDGGPLRIGDGPGQFNGSIDDVRIYDRALSQAEIRDDMEGAAPKSGIVAYYSMDDPTGTTVWNNAYWQRGKRGGGLAFDGADDHVAVGDGTNLDLDGTATLAAWINLRDTSQEQHFVDKRDSWQSSTGYAMFTSSPNLYLEYGNGTDFQQDAQSAGVTADSWTHLVVVRDDPDRYYADGQLLGTTTSLEGGIGTNDVAFAIGKSIGRGGQHVNGTLDDIRVYDTALSTQQIAALYNATK